MVAQRQGSCAGGLRKFDHRRDHWRHVIASLFLVMEERQGKAFGNHRDGFGERGGDHVVVEHAGHWIFSWNSRIVSVAAPQTYEGSAMGISFRSNRVGAGHESANLVHNHKS